MTSSSGTSYGSTGSEEQTHVVIDERKQKRMISNRESARRSRMRKQKHLDDLTAQVSQLKKENDQIRTSLSLTTQNYLSIESENSILRARMGELSNRLQSLNELIHYINSNNMGFEISHHQEFQSSNNNIEEGFMMNPWSSSLHFNQPIMASADMFQY